MSKSDDPEEKMKGSNQLDISGEGGSVPYASGGGRRGGNNARLGAAGPLGGPVSTAGNTKDLEKTLAVLRPSMSLKVEIHPNEFDLIDDQDHKRALFTDGRKLQKSKSDSDQEIAAEWIAGFLTYDEKGPRGEKITRSFQVGRDSHQLVETISVDNSRIYAPVMIRYTYDPASTENQSAK